MGGVLIILIQSLRGIDWGERARLGKEWFLEHFGGILFDLVNGSPNEFELQRN